MLRKLVLSILTMLSLFSTSVFAVGLGEIKQASGLNQPLSAQIPLLSAGDLAEYEVIASLASNQEFEKVGVERIFFLNSVKFETVRDENDQIAIKITTRNPVKEPFLNFIVELNWPNGRILREYTLLLDPPVFDENTASTIEQSSSASPPRQSRNQNQTNAESRAPRSGYTTSETYTAPETNTLSFSGNRYGPVSSMDTLWSIATKVRPSRSVSIQQTLVAIYRANPDAFSNGNINNLLKGKVLDIPGESSIQNVPQRAALQDVVMQNRQWRSGGARSISNRGSTGGSSSGSRSSGSRLSLATDNSQGNAQGYGSDAAELNKIKQELSKTQEESATLQAENDALRARLAELLENAENSSEGAINIEDAELAALAQSVENQQQQDEMTDEQTDDTSELSSDSVESEGITANQDNDEMFADPSEETDIANVDESNEQLSDESVSVTEQAQAEADQAQTNTPPSIFKPKPKNKGIIEKILDSGTILYVGIAVLVLVVLLVFWQMKKRMEEDEFQDDLVASTGAGSMDTTETFELPDVGDDMLGELDMDDDEPGLGEHSDESFDPIGEADIYIAYGKHDQAESILLDAIEDNPVRADLKVKLMECYAETENREQFESLAEEVSEAVDSEEWAPRVEEMRNKAWGNAATSSDDDFDLPSTEDIFGDDEEEEFGIGSGEADKTTDHEQDFLLEDEDNIDSVESLDDIDNLDDFGGLDDVEDSVDDLDSLDDIDDLGDIDDLDDIGGFDKLDTSTEETDDFNFDSDDSEDLNLDDDFGLDEEGDGEIDFEQSMGDDGDEIATKLDLARAYVDMGDSEGAKEILKEVIDEGSDEQKAEAQALIDKAD